MAKRRETCFYVEGRNSYQHRGALKAMGFRWRPEAKMWLTFDSLAATKAKTLGITVKEYQETP
jgi:hypothetical protein